MHSVATLSQAEPSAINGLSLDAAEERRQQHLLLHVQILTPREFEIAGDALVEACPTWAWESGDREMNNPYLPTGKQFLITRNVPCAERASYIESYADQLVAGERTDQIDEKEVEEEWITTSSEIDKEEKDGFQLLPQSNIASTDKAAIPTIGDEDDRFESMNESKTDKGVIESMEDIPDISDLDIGGSIPTNTAQASVLRIDAEAPSAGNAAKDEEPSSMADAQDKAEISALRTYDVIISYDMMYYVPRCWLIGYDAQGSPLTKREVMEDIIKDYRLKTVTIESHPHIKRGGAVVRGTIVFCPCVSRGSFLSSQSHASDCHVLQRRSLYDL